MRVLWTALLTIPMTLFLGSCSVISQQIRTESIPQIQFKTLLLEKDKYMGNTVILGGYILEIQNLADKSLIKVLQVPLGFGEKPKSKDLSEGKFIISQKGFLDPEIYNKDRRITVAGTIVGAVVEKIDDYPQPYLKIESREIYLWPEEAYYYPAPYYDPWFYPYPYYPYRHRHYPYYW
ncbi:MAG: Slp family lipoprotein [Desulfobacterales bacterium]|nr:Slp family lipoprotein [Desulfobacterales bacterium]